jgi:hypothetical protein
VIEARRQKVAVLDQPCGDIARTIRDQQEFRLPPQPSGQRMRCLREIRGIATLECKEEQPRRGPFTDSFHDECLRGRLGPREEVAKIRAQPKRVQHHGEQHAKNAEPQPEPGQGACVTAHGTARHPSAGGRPGSLSAVPSWITDDVLPSCKTTAMQAGVSPTPRTRILPTRSRRPPVSARDRVASRRLEFDGRLEAALECRPVAREQGRESRKQATQLGASSQREATFRKTLALDPHVAAIDIRSLAIGSVTTRDNCPFPRYSSTPTRRGPDPARRGMRLDKGDLLRRFPRQ